MSETLSVALWATNMGIGPRSAEVFVDLVAAQLDRAAAEGADLLLMPEHVSEAWLAYAPADLPETAEIAWLAEEAAIILPRLRELALARRIALHAGTVPVKVGEGRWRNRAHLFVPEGETHIQDKLSLTPDERDPLAWTLEPGDTLGVVSWRGLRLATVICLDIEQPALAARLQPLDLDLVLVPSDTGKLSGYSRVFACAKARAVELFTVVAVVGGVGPIAFGPPRPNVSGAAVYLPCEEAFGFTGTLAELPPSGESTGAGELLVVRDVPVGEVRRHRHAHGEVWPGPWSADHVTIKGATGAARAA